MTTISNIKANRVSNRRPEGMISVRVMRLPEYIWHFAPKHTGACPYSDYFISDGKLFRRSKDTGNTEYVADVPAPLEMVQILKNGHYKKPHYFIGQPDVLAKIRLQGELARERYLRTLEIRRLADEAIAKLNEEIGEDCERIEALGSEMRR